MTTCHFRKPHSCTTASRKSYKQELQGSQKYVRDGLQHEGIPIGSVVLPFGHRYLFPRDADSPFSSRPTGVMLARSSGITSRSYARLATSPPAVCKFTQPLPVLCTSPVWPLCLTVVMRTYRPTHVSSGTVVKENSSWNGRT